MTDAVDRVGAALRHLLDASHLAGADDLPRLIGEAARLLGAREGVAYLVDYEQVLLVPLVGGTELVREPVPVDGTLAGRAFTEVAVVDGSSPAGAVRWLPLLDGTERVGVLQLTLPPPAAGADPDGAEDGSRYLASLVAELLVTFSSYGDSLERARRRLPLSLPAELQWTQLPPLTFATPRVAISAVLVPATEVAGDSFDYSVDDGVARIALVDAMGHGLEATLLSIVAIGALRNARRTGLDLVDCVRSVDKHLAMQFGPDQFVTGIVGELDLRSGVWRWVTAGHPPALLVRAGRVVKVLEAHVCPPLGLLWAQPEVGEERLEPGDRLLLHTDGVVEARNADGEFFGTRRLVDFVTKQSAAGRPASETLRRLTQAILDHHGGELQDDATTMMIEWLGDEPPRNVI